MEFAGGHVTGKFGRTDEPIFFVEQRVYILFYCSLSFASLVQLSEPHDMIYIYKYT